MADPNPPEMSGSIVSPSISLTRVRSRVWEPCTARWDRSNSARRARGARRATEPSGRQPGKLGGFLQVNLARSQGVRDIGRELKQREVLADEAVYGDVTQCFTLKNATEMTGGFNQLFARPPRRPAPRGVRRRAALHVPDRVEKAY
jgi:hypothetical protein